MACRAIPIERRAPGPLADLLLRSSEHRRRNRRAGAPACPGLKRIQRSFRVERLADPAQQGRSRKRFMQEKGVVGQDPPIVDHVVGIARHVEYKQIWPELPETRYQLLSSHAGHYDIGEEKTDWGLRRFDQLYLFFGAFIFVIVVAIGL